MRDWVELRCKGRGGRGTEAQEAAMLPFNPAAKDIHDKRCHICDKIGNTKR
jgi:hypothetical protein